MRRALFFMFCLFFAAFCFAQQNSGFTVIGQIPNAGDHGIYQIQVGAFQHFQHAEKAFAILKNASLYPVYERFSHLTRVVINGIAARDVPYYLQRIQYAGFTEVIIRVDDRRAAWQTPVYPVLVNPRVIEIIIDPVNTPETEETPAPSVPAQEVTRTREAAPAPRPQQPPPPPPLPPLPAPGNRYPEDGYRLGEEQLRRQNSIQFSWDAVEGATSYILTIYRETPQGHRQIFTTDPLQQTHYTLDNLDIFENTGNYVWRVEAINNRQRGRPGDNGFMLNVPRPEQVRVKDPGILYGTE